MQLGARHRLLKQTLLVQSPPPTHILLSAHFGHIPPPQSTSVSLPFLSMSLHDDAWHTLFEQTPVWQSLGIEQARPFAHLAQMPPQSTSVSMPFFTPSMQLA